MLAKTSCPAAPGSYRLFNSQNGVTNSPWPACTAWQNFVLSTIKKLAPQLVVDSSSDNLYLMSASNFADPSQVKSAFGAFSRLCKSAQNEW